MVKVFNVSLEIIFSGTSQREPFLEAKVAGESGGLGFAGWRRGGHGWPMVWLGSWDVARVMLLLMAAVLLLVLVRG